MLRIAVCDDEALFQRKLSDFIRKTLGKFNIDSEILCFSSGEELTEGLSKHGEIDIMFLDVNMREMDGIETAKIIRMYSPAVHIVFVTAYISYALDGYTVDADRYLLKDDENFERSLEECIKVIIKKMNYREKKVAFDFRSGRMELTLDRILYIESRLHKSIFYVLDNGVKEYYMYEKLDSIQELLNDKGFIRVHQSFIVNIKYVDYIKRYSAVLFNGTGVSISKKYYKAAEAEFIRAKGEI